MSYIIPDPRRLIQSQGALLIEKTKTAPNVRSLPQPSTHWYAFRAGLGAPVLAMWPIQQSIPVQYVLVFNEGPGNLWAAEKAPSTTAPAVGTIQPGGMLPPGVGIRIDIDDMSKLNIASVAATFADIYGAALP